MRFMAGFPEPFYVRLKYRIVHTLCQTLPLNPPLPPSHHCFQNGKIHHFCPFKKCQVSLLTTILATFIETHTPISCRLTKRTSFNPPPPPPPRPPPRNVVCCGFLSTNISRNKEPTLGGGRGDGGVHDFHPGIKFIGFKMSEKYAQKAIGFNRFWPCL